MGLTQDQPCLSKLRAVWEAPSVDLWVPHTCICFYTYMNTHIYICTYMYHTRTSKEKYISVKLLFLFYMKFHDSRWKENLNLLFRREQDTAGFVGTQPSTHGKSRQCVRGSALWRRDTLPGREKACGTGHHFQVSITTVVSVSIRPLPVRSVTTMTVNAQILPFPC